MNIFQKELINVSHSVSERVSGGEVLPHMPNHNEFFIYHFGPQNAGVTREVACFNYTVSQNNKHETTISTSPFLSEYFLRLQTLIWPNLTSKQSWPGQDMWCPESDFNDEWNYVSLSLSSK